MLVTCKQCRLQYGPSVTDCLKCRQRIVWDRDETESFAELEIKKMISEGYSQSRIRSKLIDQWNFSETDADSFLNDAFLVERSGNRWAGLFLFFGGFVFLAMGVIWVPLGLLGVGLIVIGGIMTLTGRRVVRDR